MSTTDTIALGALMIGLISGLFAFIYWLTSISYKVTKFIFELNARVTELLKDMEYLKHTTNSNQRELDGIISEVGYHHHILLKEYPEYFKRNSDQNKVGEDYDTLH
jgi:hypothetical protein